MVGIGNILGNLKGMAEGMGAEIEKQNKQLDLIQGKVIVVIRIRIILKNYFMMFRLRELMLGLNKLTRERRNCLNKKILL